MLVSALANTWIANSINNPSIPISDAAVRAYLVGNTENDAGMSLSPRGVLGLSAIWRAINMLSGDVAKLPLDLFRRTEDNGKEKATDHPAYATVRDDWNEFLSAFHGVRLLTAHALLHGNGYAQIVRPTVHGPIQLWPLPPSPTTYPVFATNRSNATITKGYATTIDGQIRTFKADAVIHISGLSWDGIQGMDVYSVMANTFGLEMAANKHAARFFKRGTLATGYLSVPVRLPDKQFKELLANWNRMASGLDNTASTAVLHGGADFKPISIDPEKAQLLESRKFGLTEIANVFNMPPHKLGSETRTSFASLEAENADYLTVTLDPWLIVWEQECRKKLLTDDERASREFLFEFNRDALMRADAMSRALSYAKYREIGVLTANQVAAKENLPTMGAEGDRRYVPANWVPLDEDGLPATPAVSQQPPASGSPRAPGEQEEARAALFRAIRAAADHLIGYEARAVQDAAGREKNFIAWIDDFYGTFQSKLLQAVIHDLNALAAVLGRFDGTQLASQAVGKHVRESMAELLDLAGGSKPATFAGVVRDATANWLRRAAAFVQEIERLTQ